MTTMPEPMTLEQVRDFLRAEYDMRVANRSASLHKTADFLRASDSIDAELAKQRNAEPVVKGPDLSDEEDRSDEDWFFETGFGED